MVKKKVETTNSVALFDEEPPVKKAPVKVKKETKKKDGSTTIKNSSRSATSVDAKHASVDKKPIKKTGPARGSKQSGTSDSAKKPRRTSKSDAKNNASTKQPAKNTKRSSNTAKVDTVKRTTRRNKENSDRSTETSPVVGREKQTVVDTASTDFVKAKKNQWKFKRGTEIWPPKQITGKPKSIKDGELLAIIVDGKYLEVSPWSVKDGVYRQGMDGNYLVKYLHYETVSTKYDALNEELSNINTKKKEKK